MDILITTRSLPEHIPGGMEYYAKDTAVGLAQLGNSVTVLTTDLANKNSSTYEAQGVKVHYLKGTKPGRYSRQWWKQSSNFYKENKDKYDVVLSVSTSGRTIAALKERCPIILQCHGTVRGEIEAKWRSKSLWNLIKSIKNIAQLINTKKHYSLFNYVVAVGDRVLQDLSIWPLNLDVNKFCLIRNGVPRNKFIKPSQKTQNKVISLCRLHQQKGVQYSVKAFKTPELSNITLDIAGSGPFEATLKNLKEDSNNINFIGHIERDSVPRILTQYDAFIFTSTRIEGYPLNLIEALAAELPIVASKHLTPALPVSAGVFPVDPTNSKEVANAIQLALNSPRPKLPEKYYIENVMKQYAQICEEQCAKKLL